MLNFCIAGRGAFPKPRAVRIAVVADTHDHIPASLPGRLKRADEIWHLGDVCAPAVLAEFSRLGPPLHVVRGNCDAQPGWPLELTLEREGLRFFLVHIPPPRAPAGVHVLLHGHTHVPRDEVRGGVRWLNPGSASHPRGAPPSFGWLEVEAGKLTRWSLGRI